MEGRKQDIVLSERLSALGKKKKIRKILRSKQSAMLLRVAQKFLWKKRFHDVTLACRCGEEMTANRAFLAASSETLSNLLTTADVVELDVSKTALRMVLSFLHGELWQPADSVVEMTEAYSFSRKCRIPEFYQYIREEISQFLADRLTRERVGVVLDGALTFDAKELALDAVKQLEECADFKLDSESFLGWSTQSIVFFVKNAAFIDYHAAADAMLAWADMQTDVKGKRTIFPSLDAKAQLTEALTAIGVENLDADYISENIEPLNIVDVRVLLDAYRAQACRKKAHNACSADGAVVVPSTDSKDGTVVVPSTDQGTPISVPSCAPTTGLNVPGTQKCINHPPPSQSPTADKKRKAVFTATACGEGPAGSACGEGPGHASLRRMTRQGKKLSKPVNAIPSRGQPTSNLAILRGNNNNREHIPQLTEGSQGLGVKKVMDPGIHYSLAEYVKLTAGLDS